MTNIFLILLGTAFANNFVLAKLFAPAPIIGVSNRLESVHGIALATGVALTLSAALSWMAQHWMLEPLGLGYLRTLAYVLVILVVAYGVDAAMARTESRSYRLLGRPLPLIAMNCAVLGVALLDVQKSRSLFEAVLHGFGAALGFALVLVMFSAMRVRLETADVPAAWRGAPIALVTAGLMSLAFMGFAGMAR